MNDNERPIGVFDSGVGGFTVVRELRRVLPNERIVYFGDSANMPYGNKTADELLRLARRTLNWMQSRGVKAVACACNTTSSLIDRFRNDVPFKVFSVVEAGAHAAASLDIDRVGMIGTCFTAKSGAYDRAIHAERPDMRVASAGCPALARLIDNGARDTTAIDRELTMAIDDILRRLPATHLILGCTHYPLVSDRIAALYPDLVQIDPARDQAEAIRNFLRADKLLGEKGGLELNTSGETEPFAAAAKRFGVGKADVIRHLDEAEMVKIIRQ